MNLLHHLSLVLVSVLGLNHPEINLTASVIPLPEPMEINMAPVVDLGPDIVACDMVTLDAGNPGAVYLWSTGALTQTINVTTSGIYWVDVTDGTGTTRDSVEVVVYTTPTTPVVDSIWRCGPGEIALVAQSNADVIIWYDDSLGGNVVSSGDTFITTVAVNQSFYASAASIVSGLKAGYPDISGGDGYFTVTSARGISFNVTSSIVLDSVSIYVDNTLSGTVELRTSSNTLLASKPVTLTNAGANKVGLGFSIPVGTGYRLLFASPSGAGKLFLGKTNPYPLDYGAIVMTAGYPFTAHYNFFYDWEYTGAGPCRSDLKKGVITVYESPVVDLGPDTATCGLGSGIALDGFYPNATYLWNTGETTSGITAMVTDTFTVDVTLGQCTTSDSVMVNIIPDPTIDVINDLDLCSSGWADLVVGKTSEFLLWYDDPLSSQPILVGDTFSSFFLDDKTYYVEAVNVLPSQRTGLINPISESNMAFSGPGQNGLLFNVLRPITLQSFGLYVNSVGNITFEIRDSVGNPVFTKTAPAQFPFVENKIEVGVTLLPGNNYKLVATSTTGGAKLGYQTSNNFEYPYSVPGAIDIVSAANGFQWIYPYFYNLEIDVFECYSSRDSIKVDVRVPFDLPDSIYSCTDTFLTGSDPAFSHQWSTGATTNNISVTETGVYFVSVSDGQGCTVYDTAYVEIPTDAGLPDDGVLCGNVLTTNYDDNATFLWSNGATSSTLTISNPGTYSVMVNEPKGCMLFDTIAVSSFSDFPVVNMGPDFTVCDSAELDAGNQGLNFIWSSGATTQSIQIYASGSYSVTVTNMDGCATSDTIGVSIVNTPDAFFFVPDTVSGTALSVTFNNLSDFGAYFWSFGDGQTSTVNNPVHTYSQPGDYCATLIVTDLLNACGQDTFTYCFTLLEYNVGIDNELNNGFVKVYPNPATSVVYFEYPQSLLPGQVSLYEISGKQLLTTEENSINVSGISPGVYMLVFDFPDQRLFQKLLIQ